MIFDYLDDETFCKVIPHVLTSEGGYVNNPRDKGGPTKYGVAWNYNAGYLRQHFGMRVPTDIQNLSLDQARQLYYDKYWIESGANGLTDVDLAYMHLDTAVNCGVGTAARMLSKLSINPKNFDGSGGKNRTLFLTLFLEYAAQRVFFYTHCRDRDAFLAGWMNRLGNVIVNSLNMD